MTFNGKWQLVSFENAEAYYKKINTPPEFLAKLMAIYAELHSNPSEYQEEITLDKAAGKFHRVVYIHGEVKRDSGLLNVDEEFEHSAPDGRVTKGKVTLEGDNKVIFNEHGHDFTSTVTVEIHGDILTATLQSGDVVCVEKFKKV